MNKTLKRLLKLIIVLLVLVLVLGFGLGSLNKPADRSDNAYRTVIIKSGYGTSNIADALQKKGIINNATRFQIMSKIFRYDGKYQAGTYSFSPDMRPRKIAEDIVNGKTSGIKITIPEGYTLQQIAKTLEANKVCSADKFLKACRKNNKKYDKEYPFLKKAQSGDNHLEGYLYPDTYYVGKNPDPDQIIRMMLNGTEREWTNKLKARAKKQGQSINEVMIVASLIEREAGTDDDRAKVASVIYNRIKANMPLQFDSTISYAQSLAGAEMKVDLSLDDTNYDSPYNTYKFTGLPPGPICSPSKKSIEAALYPANTDYLYFVLKPELDGSAAFSNNADQFKKDVEAYSQARAAQKSGSSTDTVSGMGNAG